MAVLGPDPNVPNGFRDDDILMREMEQRASEFFNCAGGCGDQVHESETVWVDPDTGEATWRHGKPYHVGCAPPQH